jgi:Na+-driven multidrug efflux pump
VAGYGVSSRIEFFSMGVLRALSVVLAPFVGQNLGAGKIGRVISGIRYSRKFSLLWGVALYLLLALLAPTLASVFSRNPQVKDIVVLYLRIVPLGYGMWGVLMLSMASMNVLNKPLPAAAIAAAQVFVLYIPLAYLASHLYGPPGVFAALGLSYIAAGLGAHLLLNRYLAQRKALLAAAER